MGRLGMVVGAFLGARRAMDARVIVTLLWVVVASVDRQVAGRHQTGIGPTTPGLVGQVGVQPGEGVLVLAAKLGRTALAEAHAQARLLHVGHGGDDRFDLAGVICHRHQALAPVGFVARQRPDDVHIEVVEQLAWGVDAGGRVVVSGDDDDLAKAVDPGAARQKPVIQLLGRVRRVGVVEDVAGEHQHVDLALDDGIDQPVQKARLLVVAVYLLDGASQVPVGCV